jgi:hypothetical protein
MGVVFGRESGEQGGCLRNTFSGQVPQEERVILSNSLGFTLLR